MHQNDLTRELLRLVPKLGQEVEVSGLGPARGAGLGLAIVRGIVEAHRGRVLVANEAPGCRFDVVLPL